MMSSCDRSEESPAVLASPALGASIGMNTSARLECSDVVGLGCVDSRHAFCASSPKSTAIYCDKCGSCFTLRELAGLYGGGCGAFIHRLRLLHRETFLWQRIGHTHTQRIFYTQMPFDIQFFSHTCCSTQMPLETQKPLHIDASRLYTQMLVHMEIVSCKQKL